MTIILKDNERLDDLQRNGYKIIQNPDKFCFGMDAVLLTGFAHAGKEDKLLDLEREPVSFPSSWRQSTTVPI